MKTSATSTSEVVTLGLRIGMQIHYDQLSLRSAGNSMSQD
jgi:hypothetical protein